jgi:hypothetical protein
MMNRQESPQNTINRASLAAAKPARIRFGVMAALGAVTGKRRDFPES